MMLPRPILMLLSVLGVIVLASTGVGLWMALTQKPPAWFFMGFELVIVLGAVFLVLFGMGKFKNGPAITLICCAGAIGMCSLLGWQATGRAISGHSVTWLLALRGLVAGLLVAAAAADIVLRDPKGTLPRIGWGIGLAVPIVVLLALMQRGTLGVMINKLSGNSQSLAFGIWLIVGLIACVLISASGHMLITGFQVGVEAADKQPGKPGATPGAPAKPAAIASGSSPATTATPPSGTPRGTPG